MIGDSALTSGMAIEALNNAAQLNTNITVIVNDNSMSIAKSVGALSYHCRLRTRRSCRTSSRGRRTCWSTSRWERSSFTRRRTETNWHGALRRRDGPLSRQLGSRIWGRLTGIDTEAMIEIFGLFAT